MSARSRGQLSHGDPMRPAAPPPSTQPSLPRRAEKVFRLAPSSGDDMKGIFIDGGATSYPRCSPRSCGADDPAVDVNRVEGRPRREELPGLLHGL